MPGHEIEAAILAAVPEVRHIASRIGSPEVATDIMGLEQADVFIDLAPRAEWRDGIDKAQIIEEIDGAIASAAPACRLSSIWRPCATRSTISTPTRA